MLYANTIVLFSAAITGRAKDATKIHASNIPTHNRPHCVHLGIFVNTLPPRTFVYFIPIIASPSRDSSFSATRASRDPMAQGVKEMSPMLGITVAQKLRPSLLAERIK